jgi:hypothetical protein
MPVHSLLRLPKVLTLTSLRMTRKPTQASNKSAQDRMRPHSREASIKSKRKSGIYAYLTSSASVLAELMMTR